MSLLETLKTAAPKSTRKTSREAFDAIQRGGLLTKLKLRVYAQLFAFGPLTAGECAKVLIQATNGRTQIDSIRPRFAQLKALGVIEEVGERICNVTGHKAILWDVTGNLPVKPAPVKAMNEEQLAACLYEAYCGAVGGKAWNGDELPSWKEFSDDTSKAKQVTGWIIVAQVAKTILK